MIGPFPPPVHGMAVVNEMVYRAISGDGLSVRIIDIAPLVHGESFLTRFSRIPRIIVGLAQLLHSSCSGTDTVYMSVSGGAGQVYDCLFLIVVRLLQLRIYLHHHSYSYVDKPGLLAKSLLHLAGRSAEHIFLCQDMLERAKRQYPMITKAIRISNAAIISESRRGEPELRYFLETVGYLGNISEEKGVFTFLDLMSAVEAEGLPVSGLLAGPFQDSSIKARVLSRLDAMNAVTYVGSRYGSEKVDFYRSIDALVFPTQYMNEAEPLTILEAMREGLPIIAYGRGCIPTMLEPGSGLVVPPADRFVGQALQQIRVWLAASGTFSEASRRAFRSFESARADSLGGWDSLRTEISHA